MQHIGVSGTGALPVGNGRTDSTLLAADRAPRQAYEIAAGLLVAVKPKIGSYVVAAWLCGIIVNLLLRGSFYDVALRDFGLLLAALALGRLAVRFDHGLFGVSKS